MAAFHHVCAGGALALLLSTTTLHAAVTAPQVWEDWQATLTAGGATDLVVGGESYAGGTLTLNDIAFTLSEDDATVTVTLPELVLEERADGSVVVTTAARMPVHVSAENEEGAPSEIALEAEQSGLVITATGTPGALDYAVEAPLFALNLLSVTVEERDYDATGRFAVNALKGNYASAAGADTGLLDIDYAMAAESVDFTLSISEEDTSAKPARTTAFTAEGRIDAPLSAATMTLPENASGMDDAEALAAGFTLDGTQSAGTITVSFHADDNGAETAGSLTIDGAEARAAAGGIDISYGVALNGLAMDLTGDEIPFPIGLTARLAALDIALPLLPEAEPSPFVFKLDLADVALNEDVWAMFDPEKTIPRTPATLRVDLSGLATAVDPDAAPAPAARPQKPGMATPPPAPAGEEMDFPALIHALDINDVTLAFGGAKLAATGALTFAADSWAGDEVPMPVGTLSATLSGVNGLAQKLSALGLIPADQVMMGMMMLGMFTVPTGDDEMKTDIEFTPEGGITANGQSVF